MKIIFITLISILAITAITFTSNAQIGSCCPYINGIEIIPNSPTSTDNIQIVTSIATPNLGQFISKSFSVSQDTVYIETCHFGGFLTVVTTFFDTLDIGMLPAGTYQIAFTANISDSDTECSPYNSNTFGSSFVVTQSTNSLENHELDDLKIVPNPASGEFGFSVKNTSTITHFSIATTDGKTVKSLAFNPLMKVSLLSGIYFVHFYNQNELLGTKQVIVQ